MITPFLINMIVLINLISSDVSTFKIIWISEIFANKHRFELKFIFSEA